MNSEAENDSPWGGLGGRGEFVWNSNFRFTWKLLKYFRKYSKQELENPLSFKITVANQNFQKIMKNSRQQKFLRNLKFFFTIIFIMKIVKRVWTWRDFLQKNFKKWYFLNIDDGKGRVIEQGNSLKFRIFNSDKNYCWNFETQCLKNYSISISGLPTKFSKNYSFLIFMKII